MWEAQFGDFANGAQVIDRPVHRLGRGQVAPADALGMLLPHGSEGQGPEHSSARLERYLRSAPTTTCASSTHDARAVLPPAAPPDAPADGAALILFSPKSLLRRPRCVSPLER